MHQSPARLHNIAAVAKYLWNLEKETGTKSSRGLILALLVNDCVISGKVFAFYFYETSSCVTAKQVQQDSPAAQVGWQG